MKVRISFKSNIHSTLNNYVEGNSFIDSLYLLEHNFRDATDQNPNLHIELTDFKVTLTSK